jgi:glucose-1-phosphate thymidylyltransferase
MNWLVFEDDRAAQLYPITIGRACYAISCGGYRLVDRLAELSPKVHSIVRRHLSNIERLDFPGLTSFDPSRTIDRLEQPWTCLNARLAPSAETLGELRKLAAKNEPFVALSDGAVVAAVLPRLPAEAVETEAWLPGAINASLIEWTKDFSAPTDSGSPFAADRVGSVLFNYPHDVVRGNMELLRPNLDHHLRSGRFAEIRDGVFAADGVKLADYVVSETADGPILLDQHASIGPYCYLSGPAYVGPKARVIEHAALKDGVSIGHTTKIGGEVEASIIEPYSNKQHYGFLGHSYLGSWINLGAGTCNSDLKNTYGLVNMEYSGVKMKTGMQFVGCIMGDYAKTAINTGIFTGKTIGACSMAYGFVTENVPSFVNYARLFGQVAELPPEVMIATQQRMFLRRNVPQRECDVDLIREMFELTRFEREWSAGDSLSL